MSNKFLHREDAPFGEAVWQHIDETVVTAARRHVTGRRFLSTQGPFGIGLKTIPGPDTIVESDVDGVDMVASAAVPIAKIQSVFTLSNRDIAAFERDGFPFDFGSISTAAASCANQEEKLIYYGSDSLGLSGIIGAPGTQNYRLREWKDVGVMIEDVIEAATMLDGAGFHGPYALVLSPDLYNLLFRRYPHGSMTELEHARQIAQEGVFKTPAIEHGGVLVATGKDYASIVLGQDLMTGFIGPSDTGYEFILSESITLLLKQPSAFCVLQG